MSYNLVVGDLTALIDSLENVMHKHQQQSKRELVSVPAENSVSVSKSGLLDAAAQRHHHGHQHGHLHGQLRHRSMRNESQAAPAKGASAGIAFGNLTTPTTKAAMSGDEEVTATAWTTGAADMTNHTVYQTAGPNASAGVLSDDQNPRPSLDRADDKAAAPRILLLGHSTVSQATPADLSASSTGVTDADTGVQSTSQHHFSAAERVLPFGKSRLRLCSILVNLWAYFLVLLYQ